MRMDDEKELLDVLKKTAVSECAYVIGVSDENGDHFFYGGNDSAKYGLAAMLFEGIEQEMVRKTQDGMNSEEGE